MAFVEKEMKGPAFTILVVDDDPEHLQANASRLERMGYRTTQCLIADKLSAEDRGLTYISAVYVDSIAAAFEQALQDGEIDHFDAMVIDGEIAEDGITGEQFNGDDVIKIARIMRGDRIPAIITTGVLTPNDMSYYGEIRKLYPHADAVMGKADSYDILLKHELSKRLQGCIKR